MMTAFQVSLLLLAVATATVAASPQLARAKRLTAFGKTPNSSPPPVVGKGRECKTDKDCEAISYTTCRNDHRDSRKRCICQDGAPPSNGQCMNRPRGLREPCNTDNECLEGAECKSNPNATTAAQHRTKICLCRVGRIETGDSCSGSHRLVTSGITVFTMFMWLFTSITSSRSY